MTGGAARAGEAALPGVAQALFDHRYETAPPDGGENTDTIARASLIYGL